MQITTSYKIKILEYNHIFETTATVKGHLYKKILSSDTAGRDFFDLFEF